MFVLVVAIVMIVAAFAGCSEEKSSASTPRGDELPGTLDTETGWLESNWGSSDTEPYTVSTSLLVDINETDIIAIIFTIKFDDSDTAHSESDEGSNPDQVTIKAVGGAVESAEVTGETTCTLKIDVTPQANASSGDEEPLLGSSWDLEISADCYGGKPYYIIFPRPGPTPLSYKDQGVAYTLDVAFTYLSYE